MDEEQDQSYKSDSHARYHARDIARFLCGITGSLLLLASATPDIESYYKAKNNVYNLIEMLNRANKSQLPQVEICDMRAEIESGNLSIFGRSLKNKIEENLENVTDERIISAMEFIRNQSEEKLTCKEVADMVCLSEGRFSHLFKEFLATL